MHSAWIAAASRREFPLRQTDSTTIAIINWHYKHCIIKAWGSPELVARLRYLEGHDVAQSGHVPLVKREDNLGCSSSGTIWPRAMRRQRETIGQGFAGLLVFC
jgi:hypothetical protein